MYSAIQRLVTAPNDMGNKKVPANRATFLTALDLLVIAAIWILSLVVVNPTGNFPLNDDWAYGLTVRNFLETGVYRPSGWAGMPLISQVLWGSIFCIPNGCTFDALRASTLVISLLGILGTYCLIKELGQPRWFAIIVALMVAFNPIYYLLSNSFMTDIPFTALLTLAAFFLGRHLRNNSKLDLSVGSLLCILATLDRQLGIAIPLAFSVAVILGNGFTKRAIIRAVVPPILSIGALLIFNHWLATSGQLPANYNVPSDSLILQLRRTDIISVIAKNGFIALLYLGWFLLPILVVIASYIWFDLTGRTRARLIFSTVTLGILGLLSFTLLYRLRELMPLSENVISIAGIGPMTLKDIFILHYPDVALPNSFWLLITAISLMGGALLISVGGMFVVRLGPVFWPGKMNDGQTVLTFLFLSALIYMAPILIGGFFDRYLVPAIPFLAASLAGFWLKDGVQPQGIDAKIAPGIAWLLIGGFAVFTICGTRDYFTWNRVRWAALNDLMENKSITPKDIDGGFEFNGLYLYSPNYQWTPGKSWWWVKNDRFVVAFGALPGYSILRVYAYQKWLPPSEGSILLLEKNTNNNSSPGG